MWKVFWFMLYDCDMQYQQYFSHWIKHFLYICSKCMSDHECSLANHIGFDVHKFLFSAIFNAEFILSGVMRQTVDFKSYQIDVH